MQIQREGLPSAEAHSTYPLLNHSLKSSKFPLQSTSAKELRVNSLKWVSMVEQLHTSLRSKSTMPSHRGLSARLNSHDGYEALLSYTNNKGTVSAFPYRYNGGTFNFTLNYEPYVSDMDVELSSSFTNEHEWYVNAYAVSTAFNSSLSSVHSQLCYLGYVKVKRKL